MLGRYAQPTTLKKRRKDDKFITEIVAISFVVGMAMPTYFILIETNLSSYRPIAFLILAVPLPIQKFFDPFYKI